LPPENGADNATLGQPRQGLEKPGLSAVFINFPQFGHRSIIAGR
jgi:hypothetical protein